MPFTPPCPAGAFLHLLHLLNAPPSTQLIKPVQAQSTNPSTAISYSARRSAGAPFLDP